MEISYGYRSKQNKVSGLSCKLSFLEYKIDCLNCDSSLAKMLVMNRNFFVLVMRFTLQGMICVFSDSSVYYLNGIKYYIVCDKSISIEKIYSTKCKNLKVK
jgi:hypothetical protein